MSTLGKKLSENKEWLAKITKHGEYSNDSETPEHYVWRTMLARAGIDKNYEHVSVCERWKTFGNFLQDMGRRPSPQHSIDRWPDNNGNYEPTNCRWATRSEQQRNKRNNVWVEWEGQRLLCPDLAPILGITIQGLHYRLKAWGRPC